MAKLLLFNPENDIALASDLTYFTPPKAAIAMRSSGAALPLWYGDPGDCLLAYGINAAWLDSVETRFETGVRLSDHTITDGLQPSPWGWSRATREIFEREGFTPDTLPDDDTLDLWRQLSHRQTAATLCREITPMLDFEIAPPAVDFSDVAELKAYLTAQPDSIVKSPWSSSGRGLIDTRRLSCSETLRRCEGIIRRQGSVSVEKAYNRVADLAMLFKCADGECRFEGYSLFKTDAAGNYTGNILASDRRLLEMAGRLYPPDRLTSVRDALCAAITREIAHIYSGPIGVDMLIARREDGSMLLDATVEVNLRMTMGFVAHRISEKYLAEGSEGSYSVIPSKNNPANDTMKAEDRKMISGRIDLTPPGGLFRFVAEVNTL